MKQFFSLLVCFALCSTAGADDTPNSKDKKPLDPVMAKLAPLVGGVWTNANPNFVVENRFTWAFDGKVIQGKATLGKGSPAEQHGDAYLGWDPVAKSVYYVDIHGGNSVYKGTVNSQGDDIIFDFAGIVGAPAKYRESMRFTGKDEMKFTIYVEKDGKLTPAVDMTMHRKNENNDPHRLITEGIIDAPREQVWKAFATKEGQESWNVAHAEIDCRVGGKMLTHYNPDGKIGDPNTIENLILALDPGHMMTIKVGTPPAQFPFKNAIKNIWTVIYLDEVGSKQTRVRVVGNGYGDDEESQKLRSFFDKGNAATLQKLQEKFSGASSAKAVK
jgi:uncharacterized protein YndB with AHSA1/START domain